jgi:AP-2 complex subunit alpha
LQQSGTARPVVRKKAALCLLRLLRKSPASALPITSNTFSPVMIGLLEDRDLGVQQAAVTLLLGICARTGAGEGCWRSMPCLRLQ